MARLAVLALGTMLAAVLLLGAASWRAVVPGIVIALVTLGLFVYWRRQNGPIEPERVTFNKRAIVRYLPDGSTEQLGWNELDRISIVTTDQGPWSEDAYWIFEDAARENGCMIGNGAEGFPAVLDHICGFEDFNHERVIEAMGCTSNKRFIVWERAVEGSGTEDDKAGDHGGETV